MATIPLEGVAQRLRKFAFLIDNMILSSMSLALARAQRAASTVYMLPKSLTAPVDPVYLTKRSGRLAASLRVERPRADGARFLGALVAGGLNVRYAAIHEFGGTIQHPGGTPFLRTSFAHAGGVTLMRSEHRDIALKHGGGVTRPHPITIRARPYVRPALESVLPYLREQVLTGFARIRSEVGL